MGNSCLRPCSSCLRPKQAPDEESKGASPAIETVLDTEAEASPLPGGPAPQQKKQAEPKGRDDVLESCPGTGELPQSGTSGTSASAKGADSATQEASVGRSASEASGSRQSKAPVSQSAAVSPTYPRASDADPKKSVEGVRDSTVERTQEVTSPSSQTFSQVPAQSYVKSTEEAAPPAAATTVSTAVPQGRHAVVLGEAALPKASLGKEARGAPKLSETPPHQCDQSEEEEPELPAELEDTSPSSKQSGPASEQPRQLTASGKAPSLEELAASGRVASLRKAFEVDSSIQPRGTRASDGSREARPDLGQPEIVNVKDLGTIEMCIVGKTSASLPLEKRQAVADFREQLKRNGMHHSAVNETDFRLLQFLRAKKMDLDAALSMYKENAVWREENAVDGILEEDLPYEEELAKAWPVAYHGRDAYGRPICIQKLALLDVASLLERGISEDALMRYHIKTMEFQSQLVQAATYCECTHIETTFVIIDGKDFSFSKSFNRKSRRFFGKLIDIDSNHYPETLGKLVLVNAPPSVMTVWSFMKPFIDAKTKQRIFIHKDGEKAKEILKSCMSEEYIPVAYGGRMADEELFSNYTLPFVQYIPSWTVLGYQNAPKACTTPVSKAKKPLKGYSYTSLSDRIAAAEARGEAFLRRERALKERERAIEASIRLSERASMDEVQVVEDVLKGQQDAHEDRAEVWSAASSLTDSEGDEEALSSSPIEASPEQDSMLRSSVKGVAKPKKRVHWGDVVIHAIEKCTETLVQTLPCSREETFEAIVPTAKDTSVGNTLASNVTKPPVISQTEGEEVIVDMENMWFGGAAAL